jgi:hypothetical protein
MRAISQDVLGIGLTIPFSPPLTRHEARLDAFATWLCNKDAGLGLRSDQLQLKSWDELFGYELCAQFYGENGLISRNADRIKLDIKNARTASDWELVRQLIVRFYTHLQFPATSVTTFSAYVHSRSLAGPELDAYFQQFPQPKIATRPALFSYVRIVDWESDVRVLVEKSNAFPGHGGVFLGWETQFSNNQDWETFIGTLPTVMENSAHFFELSLTRDV